MKWICAMLWGLTCRRQKSLNNRLMRAKALSSVELDRLDQMRHKAGDPSAHDVVFRAIAGGAMPLKP